MVTTRKPQKLHPTVLVLVTDQLSCDRLILAGRALYRTSLNAGARMTVHYSEDPERSLVQLLADSLPHYVVTGMPGGGSDLLPRLWTRFEYLTFYTVDPAGDAQEVTAVDRALV